MVGSFEMSSGMWKHYYMFLQILTFRNTFTMKSPQPEEGMAGASLLSTCGVKIKGAGYSNKRRQTNSRCSILVFRLDVV